MNNVQPKITPFPGYPQGIQEMTLDQYMSPLAPEHTARVQLSELRTLALDGAKATTELLKALEKVRELEKRVGELSMGLSGGFAIASPPTEAGAAATLTPPPSIQTGFKCELCGKVLATEVGLKLHNRQKHGK